MVCQSYTVFFLLIALRTVQCLAELLFFFLVSSAMRTVHSLPEQCNVYQMCFFVLIGVHGLSELYCFFLLIAMFSRVIVFFGIKCNENSS